MKKIKHHFLCVLLAGMLFLGWETHAAAAELHDTDITLVQNTWTYDGTEKQPQVLVQSDGKTLVQDTDYGIRYANNKNAGSASVIITGIGTYTGSVTKTFVIEKAEQTLTSAKDTYTLSISKKLQIKVAGNQGKLSYHSGTLGVLSIDNQGTVKAKHAGTSLITVTAAETANYKPGIKKITVTVKPYSIKNKGTAVRLSKAAYHYDGKKKTPAVTVTYGKKSLKKGTH